MQLKHLTLTNVRAFEQVEFNFEPGMNLLVGINGSGKSTVLEVLRKMMSYTARTLTGLRLIPYAFDADDIRIGSDALTTKLEFDIFDVPFEHLIHIPRAAYVVDPTKDGQVREQTIAQVERNDLTPDGFEVSKRISSQERLPFVVYYSTRRSLSIEREPSRLSRKGGMGMAFIDALAHREFNIRECADWWLVQKELSEEKTTLSQRLDVLNNTVTSFIDDCTNLHATREPHAKLLVDKHGVTLDIRQLSDGERSLITMAFDLSRRLIVANPILENPLTDGQAVVLIDELDLHLHPRWQWEIVDKLTRTFSNCQFIATTHSPQIVGEVSPDNIIMIKNGQAYRPDQSLGMDTNWILRHLMGATERDAETDEQLKMIENFIEDEEYNQASAMIDILRNKVGDFPELVGLQTRIDMIAFLSENDEDAVEE